MTIFLIFLFLVMLTATAVVIENVAEWCQKSDKKSVFFFALLYAVIIITPTFAIGWILFKRLMP